MLKRTWSFLQWCNKQFTYRNRLESKLDSILSNQERMQLDILRLKYLQMVQHNPQEKAIILSIFDEYKKMGGDSWIDDIHENWLKKQKKSKKKARK